MNQDRYTGDLVLTRHSDVIHGDYLTVDHADPCIRISGELARDAQRHPSEHGSFDGDLFKVHGRNRTVIYRIEGCDDARDQLLAAWPD